MNAPVVGVVNDPPFPSPRPTHVVLAPLYFVADALGNGTPINELPAIARTEMFPSVNIVVAKPDVPVADTL
jgi:hypothetical protein